MYYQKFGETLRLKVKANKRRTLKDVLADLKKPREPYVDRAARRLYWQFFPTTEFAAMFGKRLPDTVNGRQKVAAICREGYHARCVETGELVW